MIAALLLTAAVTMNSRPPMPVSRPAIVMYTVRPGDCLWTIAQGELGDPQSWPLVYHDNRKVIGSNPDLVYPGQRLVLVLDHMHSAWDDVSRETWHSSMRPHSVGTHHVHKGNGKAGIYGAFPHGTLDCSQLERLWTDAGGSPTWSFLAAEVAMAESGGQQYATGAAGEEGYWQINPVNRGMATYDPLGNARSAIALSYDGRDWNAWTTYTSGAYRGRCG